MLSEIYLLHFLTHFWRQHAAVLKVSFKERGITSQLCWLEFQDGAQPHYPKILSLRSEAQLGHHHDCGWEDPKDFQLWWRQHQLLFRHLKKNTKLYREYGVFPEPFNWSSHFSPFLQKKKLSIRRFMSIFSRKATIQENVVPVHVNSNKMGSSIPKLICPYPKLKGKKGKLLIFIYP